MLHITKIAARTYNHKTYRTLDAQLRSQRHNLGNGPASCATRTCVTVLDVTAGERNAAINTIDSHAKVASNDVPGDTLLLQVPSALYPRTCHHVLSDTAERVNLFEVVPNSSDVPSHRSVAKRPISRTLAGVSGRWIVWGRSDSGERNWRRGVSGLMKSDRRRRRMDGGMGLGLVKGDYRRIYSVWRLGEVVGMQQNQWRSVRKHGRVGRRESFGCYFTCLVRVLLASGGNMSIMQESLACEARSKRRLMDTGSIRQKIQGAW